MGRVCIDGLRVEIDRLFLSVPQSEHELLLLRSKVLGSSGVVTQALRSMVQLPYEKRAEYGKSINLVKRDVERRLTEFKDQLHQQKVENLLNHTKEVGLPTAQRITGALNPIKSTISDLCRFLGQLGFVRIDGPEIETVQHNFDNLNMEPEHPARDPSDTFYLCKDLLMRTHTTASFEGRGLCGLKPPFRVYSIGAVYRNDEEDATHTQMFHQLELVVAEPGLTFAHLKGLIRDMVCAVCELDPASAQLDFVPAYFPFTEPSVEVYVNSQEILGGGILHPEVVKGADPSCKYIALGMGIERVVAIKTGCVDIRDLRSMDARRY
jgi:phenylalanyl-tRNA synthetase alpha chain